MNFYMTFFIKKAQTLATTGFSLFDAFNKKTNIKLIPLFGILVSVARPIVQNRL